MKLRDLVMSEVMVVVNDYDTGEIVYEGTCGYNAVFGLESDCFDMALEWTERNSKPIAFVTVRFAEGRHRALMAFMKADAELEAFLNSPARRSMNDEEARAEYKRLNANYHAAHKDWTGC